MTTAEAVRAENTVAREANGLPSLCSGTDVTKESEKPTNFGATGSVVCALSAVSADSNVVNC